MGRPYRRPFITIHQELLNPSIIGTQELLKSVRDHGHSVKKFILTSSFAAILNSYKPNTWTEHTYSEQDWNPLTMEDSSSSTQTAYRVSKLYAEKAAWKFITEFKPSFALVTMCPTLAFGPVLQPLSSMDQLNTSSQRIHNFMTGECKDEMPDTGVSFFLWIDVRDLALAHVKAMEIDEVVNKRFLLTAGYFCNEEICAIIKKHFPEYGNRLPSAGEDGGGYPKAGVYGYDNSQATQGLNLTYRTLEESVVDAVNSLQEQEDKSSRTA